MKRCVAVETKETDSSTETESLLEHTPKRMPDSKKETSPSVSVKSEDIERQINALTDRLTQQLAHFCELMKEFRDEQAHRRHDETVIKKWDRN